MVAAAWKTGTAENTTMTIYNCCTGMNKPITWGRLVSLAIEKMREHPLGIDTHKFMEIVFQFCCSSYRGNFLVSNGNST
jgi:hypothetical protein